MTPRRAGLEQDQKSESAAIEDSIHTEAARVIHTEVAEVRNIMNRPLSSRLLNVVVALLCLGGVAHAQGDKVAEREAEWQSYKVPAVNYVRHVVVAGAPEARDSDPPVLASRLLFRVPAEWQATSNFAFTGPDGSFLRIVTEKIPDGIPLSQYVISALQNLRDLADGPDSIVVRRTEIAGDEGREILMDLPDAHGVMQRRALWISVQGPVAVVFGFVTPLAKAAQLEPYFKGVVQSATIPRLDLHGLGYEELRKEAIKEDKPERLDEILALATAVDGPNTPARTEAASKLGQLFSGSPGTMVDLMLDRRA